MLGEEVRLDLVGRAAMRGKLEVAGRYLHNYSTTGPPSSSSIRRASPAPPSISCLLRFEGGRVTHIRDYWHARYAVELLQLEPLNIAR